MISRYFSVIISFLMYHCSVCLDLFYISIFRKKEKISMTFCGQPLFPVWLYQSNGLVAHCLFYFGCYCEYIQFIYFVKLCRIYYCILDLTFYLFMAACTWSVKTWIVYTLVNSWLSAIWLYWATTTIWILQQLWRSLQLSSSLLINWS